MRRLLMASTAPRCFVLWAEDHTAPYDYGDAWTGSAVRVTTWALA